MSSLTVGTLGQQTITINGASRDDAKALIKALYDDPNGTTEINGSDGSITLINRRHFTFVKYEV